MRFLSMASHCLKWTLEVIFASWLMAKRCTIVDLTTAVQVVNTTIVQGVTVRQTGRMDVPTQTGRMDALSPVKRVRRLKRKEKECPLISSVTTVVRRTITKRTVC